MEICLREIERCQRTGINPNFIVLLGDRYGWQPLPPRIPASEFDALLPHIPAGDARALAEQWYWLDENAVPPEYCLQPRTGEFETPAAWNPVEQTVHQALAHAARAAGLPERALSQIRSLRHASGDSGRPGRDRGGPATRFRILPAPERETAEGRPGFECSADLEVGKWRCRAERRSASGCSADLEVGTCRANARRCARNWHAPTAGETDARLEDLKKYLRARLPGNIEEFDPGGTAKLCNDVYARLSR